MYRRGTHDKLTWPHTHVWTASTPSCKELRRWATYLNDPKVLGVFVSVLIYLHLFTVDLEIFDCKNFLSQKKFHCKNLHLKKIALQKFVSQNFSGAKILFSKTFTCKSFHLKNFCLLNFYFKNFCLQKFSSQKFFAFYVLSLGKQSKLNDMLKCVEIFSHI